MSEQHQHRAAAGLLTSKSPGSGRNYISNLEITEEKNQKK